MTRLRPAAALAGFALLAHLSSGCCYQRPLLGRLNYCGPVLNRPLFVGNPHTPTVGVPAGIPVESAGYPVGVPVGGAPGCAGCGSGAPIGMAPGVPHDLHAHAPVGLPPQYAGGSVPPPYTGYPTPVMSPPTALGGPTLSQQLPPPQVMPRP